MAIPIHQRPYVDNRQRTMRMADLMRDTAVADAQAANAGAMASANMWSTLGNGVSSIVKQVVNDEAARQQQELAEQRALARDAAETEAAGMRLHSQNLRDLSTVAGKGAYLLSTAQKDPKNWPTYRAQVMDLAASIDPGLAEMVPVDYDQNKVSQLMESATRMQTQHARTAGALEGLQDGLANAGRTTEGAVELRRNAAQFLSPMAGSEETWNKGLDYLRGNGVPDSVLAPLGEYDEDTPGRVRDLALTPEQMAAKVKANATGSDADFYQSYADEYLNGQPWRTMSLSDKLSALRMRDDATRAPRSSPQGAAGAPAAAPGLRPGQRVTVGGQTYTVGTVYPDGSWDPRR